MVFFAVTPFLVVLGSYQNMSIKNIEIRNCLITLQRINHEDHQVVIV
jgi:hypothetical protein